MCRLGGRISRVALRGEGAEKKPEVKRLRRRTELVRSEFPRRRVSLSDLDLESFRRGKKEKEKKCRVLFNYQLIYHANSPLWDIKFETTFLSFTFILSIYIFFSSNQLLSKFVSSFSFLSQVGSSVPHYYSGRDFPSHQFVPVFPNISLW